jgi:hypothetical protein
MTPTSTTSSRLIAATIFPWDARAGGGPACPRSTTASPRPTAASRPKTGPTSMTTMFAVVTIVASWQALRGSPMAVNQSVRSIDLATVAMPGTAKATQPGRRVLPPPAALNSNCLRNCCLNAVTSPGFQPRKYCLKAREITLLLIRLQLAVAKASTSWSILRCDRC